MKMKKCVQIGERIIAGADVVRSKLDRVGQILTIGTFCAVFAATAIGAVNSQSRPRIAVAETYNEGQRKVEAGTGDNGQNLQTLDQGAAVAKALNLTAEVIGVDAFGEEAQGRADELGLTGVSRYGLLGVMDQHVMAWINNPPGIDLDNHLANQFLPGYQSDTTVYAQGEGFEMLRTMNIEDIWEMFRNMGYALMVIIIMVAGFMIMFRFKVASGAAISLFNSLPNIILGLIFITFSFAIVGFVLDLGRLLTAIIATYMVNNLSGSAPGFEVMGLGGPLEMAWNMFTSTIPGGVAGLGAGVGVIGVSFLAMLLNPATVVVGLIVIVVILIAAAIALYAAFRVYFTLVMTWIKILIDLILGPIYIVMGSLPGKEGSITQWVKRLIAATLVFPLVFLIINLGRYIGESSMSTGFAGPISFISGGDTTNSLFQWRAIFVIGTYFFAASAPALAQDLIGVEESKGVKTAVGETKAAVGKIPIVGGLFG